MIQFFVRRLLLSLLTLFILMVVVFGLSTVGTENVAQKLAGAFASQQRVDQLRTELGLDDPLLTRFWRQVKDVITLDFGESYSQPGVRVVDLIRPALWRSAKLVILAIAMFLPLSILGGITAARKKDTLFDRGIVAFGLASASIPDFVSGVLLQAFLGVQLGIFKPIANPPEGAPPWEEFTYLILPALAIVLVYFGYIARITRAGAVTAFDADYTRTAYMKGIRPSTVVRRHVLKNALQPTVAVTGTQMGYLFGGLVGLELVFNYNGLGRLILRAALAPDFPLLQAGVLTVAIIFMVATLTADMLIAWMNPRARLDGDSA